MAAAAAAESGDEEDEDDEEEEEEEEEEKGRKEVVRTTLCHGKRAASPRTNGWLYSTLYTLYSIQYTGALIIVGRGAVR